MIRAIETVYNGYRFRSRLEARWATVLDALDIKWQYEIEGYELEDGEWYLPDFWCPEWLMWLEVKPDLASTGVAAKSKAEGLARGLGCPVLMVGELADTVLWTDRHTQFLWPGFWREICGRDQAEEALNRGKRARFDDE